MRVHSLRVLLVATAALRITKLGGVSRVYPPAFLKQWSPWPLTTTAPMELTSRTRAARAR